MFPPLNFRFRPVLFVLSAVIAALGASNALAARQTVCTITVNSSDEKEAFRRHLPAARFQFVELVERGRPDWLESARERGIQCDILVISGHYDGGDYAGGNEFFSEHVESREYLPVDEMERVACIDPGNGVFSHLKAVYLFGCNTLNPEPLHSAARDIARSLEQSGHSTADAQRLSRTLSARFPDSSRDRMRHIFRNVPAIFGFSSVAPLGPTAATYLDRYLQSGGSQELASGHPTARIAGYFPGRSLTVARGVTDGDADAAFRRDGCEFYDGGLSDADRVAFIHRLLERDMAEVRFFLDRLEHYSASLTESVRQAPQVARGLESIAQDEAARSRYLKYMRASTQPQLQVRLIGLAERLGWLSPEQKRAELRQLIAGSFARGMPTAAEVDLACTLNRDHALDQTAADLASNIPGDVGHAAMLACLGQRGFRGQLLRALTSPREGDAEIAQTYVRHYPIASEDELRDVVSGLAQSTDPSVQVRALDTIARFRVSDPSTLEELAGLFPAARSIGVQRAIAGVLLRSDYQEIPAPDLARTLREHRLKSPDGRDLIDVLITRLQSAS